MKITVTGSLGNISHVLIEKLATNGHEVKVISSNAEKIKEIEKLKATPLIGSLKNAEFVLHAFKDADAVYTMIPPDFSVPDYYDFADKIHQNYVQAIEQNNIQYAVNLSSIGVAFAGTEPLTRYYNLEKRLDEIPGLNVVHLRPAMFYTNFYGSLEMIKHQSIIGHNLAETVDLLMTHPGDIAEAAFTYLNSLSFSGHQIRHIVSDVKNGKEIAQILSDAINKPLHWVEFPDDALLAGLLQNGFSQDAAETLIVNAGKAIREGLFNEYKADKYKLVGSRKFVDFAKEFAMAYKFNN
ncbi:MULTISPECIES: NAD(P)H-binding protein [Niastella]|uniref:NAD(P)H-binding protein n=1 Tax=Niastella soli TaxID=2821487 RepID=A0ABS3YVM4_9BACT|nr:NAD(P)H-binding protein [Niastella soli]MBO9201965.1 NAD(P)H-binding protein [Niastella soli]